MYIAVSVAVYVAVGVSVPVSIDMAMAIAMIIVVYIYIGIIIFGHTDIYKDKLIAKLIVFSLACSCSLLQLNYL